jgi:hypothetical protein
MDRKTIVLTPQQWTIVMNILLEAPAKHVYQILKELETQLATGPDRKET